ncbi:hypothetical protein D1O30_19995 [Methylocystis hirsuta]|uniref:Uncharacterized protein n=1 Tax=Methylocystis hirsuta TaxID=369798 RepID=A0A3M9XJQ2_9HYPH|nr:hypothetical protein D1O30_19995 [Methylocystis hirsuta]
MKAAHRAPPARAPALALFVQPTESAIDLKTSHPAAANSIRDGFAFFQGQAEIFEMRLVHIAPDKENLSSRRNAIDTDKFRQYRQLNNSRHRPASSMENLSLHDLRDPHLFPTPVGVSTRSNAAPTRSERPPRDTTAEMR